MGEVTAETIAALYTLPPAQFTAARTRAAAEAKARGDDDAATAIGKLRKPTTGAWLVNLVAHRRPDLIAALLEVGDRLREAQQAGRNADVRHLSEERGQAINAIVAAAIQLSGAKVPVDDLHTTLFAAVSDPQVGAEVSAGRLEKSVAYSGFGGLAPLAPAPPAPVADTKAARQIEQAKAAEKDARARLAKAMSEQADAAGTLDEVTDELHRVTNRHRAATAAADRAAQKRADAEQRLAAAQAALAELEG